MVLLLNYNIYYLKQIKQNQKSEKCYLLQDGLFLFMLRYSANKSLTINQSNNRIPS